MKWQPAALQNTSGFSGETPTIKISKDDPEWEQAFTNWKSGKNPTNSPEWKKGVILIGEYHESAGNQTS